MAGHLTMSKKECERLVVMAKVMKAEMKISEPYDGCEASELLDLSYRQTFRIAKRYGKEGARGLVHRSRGRASESGVGRWGKTEDFGTLCGEVWGVWPARPDVYCGEIGGGRLRGGSRDAATVADASGVMAEAEEAQGAPGLRALRGLDQTLWHSEGAVCGFQERLYHDPRAND